MTYEMESREHVEAASADMLRAENARLRAERDEAREALGWYANSGNWQGRQFPASSSEHGNVGYVLRSKAEKDRGQRAREALEGK